jgi:hypothetical protein
LGGLGLPSFSSFAAAFGVSFLVVAGGRFAPFAGRVGRVGGREGREGEYEG